MGCHGISKKMETTTGTSFKISNFFYMHSMELVKKNKKSVNERGRIHAFILSLEDGCIQFTLIKLFVQIINSCVIALFLN